MGRLEDIGFVEIRWKESFDGVIYAEGLRDYIIDTDNEVTVMDGDKVVKTIQGIDLHHAVGMVIGNEAVCRWQMRDRRAQRKDFAPSKGYTLGHIDNIEIDLYQAFDAWTKCRASRSSESFAEGIAHALGILRGTSCDDEWEQIEEKWKEVNLRVKGADDLEPQSHGSQAQTETTPI